MKEIPKFASKAELFAWLKANKSIIIAEKKSAIKYGDAILHHVLTADGNEQIIKSIKAEDYTGNELECSLVINTTNIMDSHSDVHFPGLWKKSLSEQKLIYLLQEHQMNFKGIISQDLKALTKNLSWRSLGYEADGNTQALVFIVTIKKDRNPFMFDQYLHGYVNNHSVGMQYVKIDLAINSESKMDEEEKKIWDKYINEVVNKDEVEEQGYFWAVTEAKVVEGSAVVIGSNRVTPVLSTTGKEKPSADTPPTEPEKSTRKQINYSFLTNNLKLN